MYRFDKKFVHFMWSDELEGKTVFFANYISDLKERVENNNTEYCDKVTQGETHHIPFKMAKGSYWQFCYWDPHYEAKVAHEQGKKIECKRKGDAWDDWDYTPSPTWLDDLEYRIMPEEQKPVTNRELARWLAQGNGEYYEYDCDGWESHRCIEYQYEEDNLPVSKVMVRKWEDEEWHEPTREYMGFD